VEEQIGRWCGWEGEASWPPDRPLEIAVHLAYGMIGIAPSALGAEKQSGSTAAACIRRLVNGDKRCYGWQRRRSQTPSQTAEEVGSAGPLELRTHM